MLDIAKKMKAELECLEHDRGLIILDVDTGAIYSTNGARARTWSALSIASGLNELAHTSSSSTEPLRDVQIPANRGGAAKMAGEEDSTRWHYVFLTVRAWLELTLYDWRLRRGGFGRIHRQLTAQRVAMNAPVEATQHDLCEAVNLAACLYFKLVKCLQRSVVTVSLLRKYGISASLVIGCRPSPFFAHAWAEVDRQVVNDSPGYQRQLTVLYRQEPSLCGKEEHK